MRNTKKKSNENKKESKRYKQLNVNLRILFNPKKVLPWKIFFHLIQYEITSMNNMLLVILFQNFQAILLSYRLDSFNFSNRSIGILEWNEKMP